MFLLHSHYAILFMMCDSKHALASELIRNWKRETKKIGLIVKSHAISDYLRQSLKMAVVKELEALVQKWRGVAETNDGGVL